MTTAEVESGRSAVADWLRARGGMMADSIVQLAAPAETAPAFRGLVADAAAQLWVRLSATGADGDRYAVFSPEGIFSGSVLMPADERVLAIRGDRIALLIVTAEGIESVAVHRLTR